MAGVPCLLRIPRERTASARLPRVQRDRQDVPWLLVETAEGVEALLDFLMRSEQAPQLIQGTSDGDSCGRIFVSDCLRLLICHIGRRVCIPPPEA